MLVFTYQVTRHHISEDCEVFQGHTVVHDKLLKSSTISCAPTITGYTFRSCFRLGPHKRTKCVRCIACRDVRCRNRKKPIDLNIRGTRALLDERHNVRWFSMDAFMLERTSSLAVKRKPEILTNNVIRLLEYATKYSTQEVRVTTPRYTSIRDVIHSNFSLLAILRFFMVIAPPSKFYELPLNIPRLWTLYLSGYNGGIRTRRPGFNCRHSS
jgi:hypothetical protein